MAEATKKTARVKMLTGLAGKHAAYKPNDIVDFPADEAARHVAAGNATPLSEEDEAAEDAANAARAKVRADRLKAK